jgi:hypothetical protein
MGYVSESCFIVVTLQVIVVGLIWCPLLLAFPEIVELIICGYL